MRNSYRGRYRRRRRSRAPLLLILIFALGLGTVLFFTRILPGLHPQNPRHEDPGQQDPGQQDPGQTDPGQTDPGQQDPGQTDPGQTDPVQTDPVGYERIEASDDQQQYKYVYRIGDAGFEMYTFLPDVAQKYAAVVNRAADQLQGTADVYAVTVPLSSSITMPDDLRGGVFGDQEGAEKQILSLLNGNVKTVPLYDALMRHRTEYVYYRTDHHWTALGAYYGYRSFCQVKGVTPHELTDYWTEEFPGFLGSFFKDCDENKQMEANPDTVTVYHPVTTTARLVYTDDNGQQVPWKIISDVSDWSASMKYNTFIGGDNSYTVITNPEVEDDSSCVVVKESFGNAMVPYLVDHYHTVHVVDYRKWNGDLETFVRDNGVQDVIFINNLSAIRSSYLMGKLQEIIG